MSSKHHVIIYMDDEGAARDNLFKEYIEGERMELHRTRGRPAIVEWNKSEKPC